MLYNIFYGSRLIHTKKPLQSSLSFLYNFWRPLMNRTVTLATKLFPAFVSVGVSVYYITHNRPLVGVTWILIALLYSLMFMKNLWRKTASAKQVTTDAIVTSTNIWQHISAAGKGVWDSFRSELWLWSGIIFAFVALSFFGVTYSKYDSECVHLGLLTITVSVCFFITHFDGWTKVKDTFNQYPISTWLILSFVSLAVTLGHAIVLRNESTWWYAVLISLFSLIMAVVTAANGWRTLAGLLIGEKGLVLASLTWSLLSLILTATLMMVWRYIGLSEELWYLMAASSATFLILLLVSAATALKSSTDQFGKAIGFTDR